MIIWVDNLETLWLFKHIHVCDLYLDLRRYFSLFFTMEEVVIWYINLKGTSKIICHNSMVGNLDICRFKKQLGQKPSLKIITFFSSSILWVHCLSELKSIGCSQIGAFTSISLFLHIYFMSCVFDTTWIETTILWLHTWIIFKSMNSNTVN